MTMQPLYFEPGIAKANSAYGNINQMAYTEGRMARGRFSEGNHIRFSAGYPEKIGGWIDAANGVSITDGTPRGHHNWMDLSLNVRTAVGTNNKLYLWQGSSFADATPYRGIATVLLNNALTTVSGSAIVKVTHAAHGLSTNDYVQLAAAAAYNGIQLGGTYYITKLDADHYNVTAANVANASSGPGGGGVAGIYFRKFLGSDPITTVSGSATVTIADTAHGALAGDFVSFSGATAVNGVTISGEYKIQALVSANAYTITASGPANASGSGGGSVVLVQYDINSGNVDNSYGNGYGVGGYGTSGYGSAAGSYIVVPCASWTFGTYGQQLLANPYGGLIYVYDPSNAAQVTSGRLYPLYNSPTCNAIMVTPERFVFAFGINGSPKKLAWPDQNDYTNWTPAITNTANSGRVIQNDTQLVGGLPLRDGISLFFTQTDCFTATYTGDNYVYQTNLAGKGAGLAGPHALIALGSVLYWMGDTDFWCYNGTVQAMPSDDIRDYVFRNINKVQLSKCFAGTVRLKREVWFFYPSVASNEIDSYVIYHTDSQSWSTGTMVRTSWQDSGLYKYPTALDASGHIYYHENGVDAAGSPLDAYITYAPMDLSNGETQTRIQGFWPDFGRIVGNVNLTILTRNYPLESDTLVGPFSIPADGSVPRVDCPTTSHMIGYKLESNVLGGDFRVGLNRAEVQIAGTRR